MLWRSGVSSFLALSLTLENSLSRVISRRVHQGWDLGEGWEQWVRASIVEVRVGRVEDNQWSSFTRDGFSRGAGTC